LKLSATPPRTRHAPPLLGEHGGQVLADWLGWDDARVAAAQADGALGPAPELRGTGPAKG